MIPQANQIYKHFKGNLYKVITVATHTETEEQLVIYQALYGDFKIYARPLTMFTEEVDRGKYPNATQKFRFEPLEQLVEAVIENVKPVATESREETVVTEKTIMANKMQEETTENIKKIEVEPTVRESGQEENSICEESKEEEYVLDPMVEAYLDTDSCREKINILHGLQHRITEDMLTTMAIVIDFELPEGDIFTKYNALHDCLLTKEKYECNRMS